MLRRHYSSAPSGSYFRPLNAASPDLGGSFANDGAATPGLTAFASNGFRTSFANGFARRGVAAGAGIDPFEAKGELEFDDEEEACEATFFPNPPRSADVPSSAAALLRFKLVPSPKTTLRSPPSTWSSLFSARSYGLRIGSCRKSMSSGHPAATGFL